MATLNYTYDQKEMSEKIFHFIYGCAMHDAIWQQAFTGEKKWVGKVKEAKEPLQKYIDRLIARPFENQKDHDKVFLDTANKICNQINTAKPPEAKDTFSFGNAQKLINIAAKHTYGLCYYRPALRENFQFCHCPLDVTMRDYVWAQYLKTFGKTERSNALGKGDDFLQPWGCEGQDGDTQRKLTTFPDRYAKFQAAVKAIINEEKGDLYPIEFDYLLFGTV